MYSLEPAELFILPHTPRPVARFQSIRHPKQDRYLPLRARHSSRATHLADLLTHGGSRTPHSHATWIVAAKPFAASKPFSPMKKKAGECLPRPITTDAIVMLPTTRRLLAGGSSTGCIVSQSNCGEISDP
jgi:hypothetical protein